MVRATDWQVCGPHSSIFSGGDRFLSLPFPSLEVGTEDPARGGQGLRVSAPEFWVLATIILKRFNFLYSIFASRDDK